MTTPTRTKKSPAAAEEPVDVETQAPEDVPVEPEEVPEAPDLTILDPDTNTVLLPACGLTVEIQELITRQFFKLLKILTKGAGANLTRMSLDTEGGEEAFVQQLLTWTLLSIPEAEDDAIEFIQAMVLPVGVVKEKARLDPQTRQHNQELLDVLYEALENPDLEDTMVIFSAIVQKEGGDIQRLGKRLRSMFALARKTGQINSIGPASR